MKIEIDIDDETAACLWANGTWWGKTDKTVETIVTELICDESNKFRRAFPGAIARSVENFERMLASATPNGGKLSDGTGRGARRLHNRRGSPCDVRSSAGLGAVDY